MAHAAIGELLGVDVIISDKCFSERELIGRGPVQIENLVARADIFFRRSMAFEAPLHVKRVRLPGERHLIQLSMARRTADAMIYVNTVIKKYEIRRVRNAIPA